MNFKGVQRRFNKIFTYNNIDIYDDYAHHPTEIKVVLQGVRKVFNKYEKVCIFQPHRISRAKRFKKRVFLCFQRCRYRNIMSHLFSREKIKLGFSYDDFAREIIRNSDVKLFLVRK